MKADIDLSGVTISGRNGDFNPTSLAHVINKPTINKLVVQSWLEKAGELLPLLDVVEIFRALRSASRKSTLVFCVSLAHVRDLTDTFRQAGVNAAYVYAGTPAAERKALINSFKRGEIPVLLNCGAPSCLSSELLASEELTTTAILTEGTDIPNVDCVVVAKPTRSRNLFAQMVYHN